MNNRLVVLNDCMLNNEQVKRLKQKFTSATFYTDTDSEEKAIERIGTAEIVIMDQFMFTPTEKMFFHCKNIKLIIINTTAYDNIDLNLLRKYKVKLLNQKAYATNDVAETGITMVMALNSNLQLAQQIVDDKPFIIDSYEHQSRVTDIWPGHPVIPHLIRRPLSQQTIGIVGLGNIGLRSAKLAKGLGLKVIAYNRSKKTFKNIEIVSLEYLFKNSDIIYISLSYDKNSMKGFITRELITLAKENSILVSISHPDLIDQLALQENYNRFKGIGFDYLVTNDVKNLMKLRKNNFIITPHLGSQSGQAYLNMTSFIVDSAISFSKGEKLKFVN